MTTRDVVLVTGVPGSGKSTLARQLSACLGLPLLSLDTIKESLAERMSFASREEWRSASLSVLWAVVGDLGTACVVDLWVDPSRDQAEFGRQARRGTDGTLVEVLCDVSGDTAVRRYAARTRHPSHRPGDAATLDRIRTAADAMQPMGLGPAIRVDTTGRVDVAAVVRWVRLASLGS